MNKATPPKEFKKKKTTPPMDSRSVVVLMRGGKSNYSLSGSKMPFCVSTTRSERVLNIVPAG